MSKMEIRATVTPKCTTCTKQKLSNKFTTEQDVVYQMLLAAQGNYDTSLVELVESTNEDSDTQSTKKVKSFFVYRCEDIPCLIDMLRKSVINTYLENKKLEFDQYVERMRFNAMKEHKMKSRKANKRAKAKDRAKEIVK